MPNEWCNLVLQYNYGERMWPLSPLNKVPSDLPLHWWCQVTQGSCDSRKPSLQRASWGSPNLLYFYSLKFDMSGPTSCCPEGGRKNLKVQTLELDKAATIVCSLEMTSLVLKPVTPSRKTCYLIHHKLPKGGCVM